MAAGDIYHVRGALVPAKNAIKFIGGNSDDYLQVNAAAVARVAANDTKGTFSAWVMPANVTDTMCIICAGDDNVVEFLELNIEAGVVTARCTDATTPQFVTAADQTDANEIVQHRWQHIAMVQNADGKGVKLYLNGKKMASTNSTTTDVDEWFNNLDGIDTMRIGAANKAGDASVTNEFKGHIADVKYWSVALTDAEVLEEYGGQIPQTANLQNWWELFDDFIDDGAGEDNGTAVGDIILAGNASEFSSRLAFMTGSPVVADTLTISVNNNVGHAVVIKAA